MTTDNVDTRYTTSDPGSLSGVVALRGWVDQSDHSQRWSRPPRRKPFFVTYNALRDHVDILW